MSRGHIDPWVRLGKLPTTHFDGDVGDPDPRLCRDGYVHPPFALQLGLLLSLIPLEPAAGFLEETVEWISASANSGKSIGSKED